MRTLIKFLLFLAVIVVQSCSNNDDNDCSDVLCNSGPAVFEFKIVDIETGENIIGKIISGQGIEVTNALSTSDPDYSIITENDRNILRISTFNPSDFTITHSYYYTNEEIFKFSVDTEQRTEDCCFSVQINDVIIEGADYELDEETGIYIIKKSIRSSVGASESLENYHAFFENSELEITPFANSYFNSNLKDIDVVQGDKLVFKLLTHDEGSEQVADDELTKIVYFEVDPEATEFTLNTDNFEEANALIGFSASDKIIRRVTKGEITGTKISDNEWEVEVDVASGEEDESPFIEMQEPKQSYNKSTYEDVWEPIYGTHIFN